MAKLSSEDFLAGLFATLAERDWETVSIQGNRFDRASAAAFARLEELAPAKGIEPRFYVMLHPDYGDSTVLRDAVAHLAQWDLIGLDNPEYHTVRLKISRQRAERLFRRFGLDKDLFSDLTDRFVAVYQAAA